MPVVTLAQRMLSHTIVMMRHKLPALTCASLLALGITTPRQAEACGGLFCGFTPVVQTEEAIIFDVDVPNNQVTAIINIVYQGSAEEFVWVLPLQTAPSSLETGSQQAFVTLQQNTTPRFSISEIEDVGMCSEQDGFFPGGGFRSADAANEAGGPPSPQTDDGVNVVQRKDVGPYATVVLEGTDPEAVKQWLLDNDYRITDEMMEMVTPYVAKGDTLLALKLQNDRDVGEIKPIEVKMEADLAEKQIEACIPIRMTALAANTDMPITGYFFTDSGRAIPQNFFHVVPNLLKVDWFRGGSNYRQLIADAVDEADAGHAFVTEFSGKADFLEATTYVEGSFPETELRAQTDLGQLLQILQNSGLTFRPGMQTILGNHFQQVADCQGCGWSQFSGIQIDANPAVDDILAELIEPDRRAQEIFDTREHVTRLFTMLDPEEMTVDPIFNYDATLPEISNNHTAKLIRYCGVGGAPGSAGFVVELEDGRRIFFDEMGQPNRDVIDAMPNSVRVEQLYEGTVVRNNENEINDLLDDHNALNGAGCSCGSATESKTAAGGLAGILLLALGLTLRRRRK